MAIKKVSAALALSAALMASPALADGFAVYEWSARAVGMGGAGMFSGEVSAIATNPAAITALDERGQFVAAVTHIDPRGWGSFWDAAGNYLGSEHNRPNPGIVPTMFYARKIQPNAWFGIGVFPRFGLKASYEPDWMGRYNSHNAELTTFSITPTLAWKMGKNLSLAVNAELMYANLVIDKYVGVYNTPMSWNMNLDGSTWGYGWGAGLNWDITPKWSFGFVYRSEVKQDINSANVKFRGGPGALGSLDAIASGGVTLPESYTLGLGYKFNDRTRAEFNAIRTNWSRYDKLGILFNSFPLTGGDPFPSEEVKNWQDGWRYQFGVEHKLNSRWTVRAGYVYDSLSAADSELKHTDFMVPVGKRQTYTLGFSYRNKNIEYSLGYGYMVIDDKQIANPAGALPTPGAPATATSDNNDAHIVALGIRIDM
ncbi:MAG: outer membrane protein transport protein [Pyramidobacter sp.]|nr:outer membrane protein transport protein [Pyramidobacter sp.]